MQEAKDSSMKKIDAVQLMKDANFKMQKVSVLRKEVIELVEVKVEDVENTLDLYARGGYSLISRANFNQAMAEDKPEQVFAQLRFVKVTNHG